MSIEEHCGNPGSWQRSFGRYPWKAAGKPALDNIRPYGWVQAHISRGDFPAIRATVPEPGRIWLQQSIGVYTVGAFPTSIRLTYRRGRGIRR
jgi:hypothetical protein